MFAAIPCLFNDVRETNTIALRYFPRSTQSNFLNINCGAQCKVRPSAFRKVPIKVPQKILNDLIGERYADYY